MTLKLTRANLTSVVFTRFFVAPPPRVWAAHMEPDLIRQWLLGPDGWAMPVCENDPRHGGKVRHEWRNGSTGASFGLIATYELIEAPHRSIHIEQMLLPEPTPESRVETRFDPEGSGNRMTMTMTVADPATMEAMLATGMAGGMETGYARWRLCWAGGVKAGGLCPPLALQGHSPPGILAAKKCKRNNRAACQAVRPSGSGRP